MKAWALTYLRDHTLSAMAALLVAGALMVLASLWVVQREVEETMAVGFAEQLAESVGKVRGYYSRNVVSRVKPLGVKIAHDYAEREDAIPFPATLSIEIGELLTEAMDGAKIRLYSNHPFSFRKGGAEDEFEKSALAALEASPAEPYLRFEEYNGRWSLRYANAVKMGPSCVACHNTHPASPKTDWAVGQVRGAQEVILPMDSVRALFRRGMLIVALILAAVTLASLAVPALVLGELKRLNAALERANASFRRFVPEDFLTFLNKGSIEEIELGDHVERTMTILFSDIRAFTTLSELMTPEQNFEFINDYLSRMSPVIHDHNGFIDKYVGDAIMSLFPNSAEDAVAACNGMMGELAKMNRDRAAQGLTAIGMGVGIHTGSLMLGAIGVANRMDSTVISDAVNLASRLESMTKEYNANLLISDDTFFNLDDPLSHDYRVIDRVRVKGKKEPVSVFEVFDTDQEELKSRKHGASRPYMEGLVLFMLGEHEAAAAAFKAADAINPGDRCIRIYLDRCDAIRKVDGPPEIGAGR